MSKRIGTMALCLMLGACGGAPSPDLYVLQVKTPAGQCSRTEQSLVVERPVARAEYDTKRIAILLDDTKLTYYTGAAWASPLPDQLQDFLIEDLAQRTRLGHVSADGEGASLRLEVTLHAAHVTQVDAPVAELRMTALLRDLRTRKVLKVMRIRQSVPAAANHMPDITAAFEQAAAQASMQVADGLKSHCGVK